MYYADLTSYEYGYTSYKNVLNIGWLEKGHKFLTGDFLEKTEIINKLRLKKRENLYRGFHFCEFCNKDHGNGEYIIQFNDRTYSAPALVIHYIEAHDYLPPKEFINAVLNDINN